MIEERLAELGIQLPPTRPPSANYVPFVRTGKLLYASGHTSFVTGKLGSTLSVAEGYNAAREAALRALATIRQALGSLDSVERIVKVLGMVNAAEDFAEHPKVMNGASDVLVAIFGEQGRHARSAVGMSSLPGNSAVEVELIIECA